jgi:TnpA family transposase
MPGDFLTDVQRRQYGRYEGEPDEAQLTRYFHLDDTDRALTENCRGDHNRLGFALQLTTVRFLGTFLSDPTQVPRSVLKFVALQLANAGVDSLGNYMNRRATRLSHRAEIQSHYGYQDFNTPPWRFRLSRFLYSRAWISNERPSLMFDMGTAWLIQNKVLLPGATTLQRLIIEIRERASNQLWRRLASLPTAEQKASLEALLVVPKELRISPFDRFRKGPVSISGPSFISAVERYSELQAFGLQKLDFSGIPFARFKTIARQAGIFSQWQIARMPDDKRIGTLVAFVKAFEINALDDALDVLDLLITDIAGKAKRLGKKKRLRTLKDLDRSALTLAQVCTLVLNEEMDDDQLRAAIYACVPKSQLKQSVATINEIARPPEGHFHEEMVEQYGRVRRFLPTLLNNIRFECAPAGASTMAALDYLTELGPTRKKTLDDAPLEVISKSWRRLVFDPQDRVTTRCYTLCFLDKLQDSLRRRDVYVSNSDRWGDPRAKLLASTEWQSHRVQVCRSLGHPVDGREAIRKLTQQLDTTYHNVAANFDANDAVRVDNTGDRPTLTITNLEKEEKPGSLLALRELVGKLLPKVDLTEIVLEINALTGFSDEFTHVSEARARVDDLPVSICAVLLAEACNIGLEPLIQTQVPALTRYRLSWVKQNYLRAETLVSANARLVDYQSTLPLANLWGGGDVASADGLRFVTPVKTIHSGPNPKYFPKGGRGITWYNFMSDQFSGFHGIVIPGTLRDSIYVLEGLLEQQTGLCPTEIMTDTSGASDLVFGLFWLLGYQFSPRLADAGEARFWRVDRDADYGPLDELACNYVNTERMAHHWDDMLRVTGSLKLGTIQASELIRSLLKSERPTSLALAIMEAGRINKTVYLLNFVSDESYRRRILTQLNRTEKRHALARVICHGRLGEIRRRYREGQEDQLGALGLVTNAVVLWNTIYMQDALHHLRQNGLPILDDDLVGLSPLRHEHMNVLGHYSFTLADTILAGEHRPLNQLETEFGEDLAPGINPGV